MCVPHQKYVLYVSYTLCVRMWHQYVCFERSLKLEPEWGGILESTIEGWSEPNEARSPVWACNAVQGVNLLRISVAPQEHFSCCPSC